MGDKDQPVPIPYHLAHNDKQFIHFLGGEDGGRLIQDKECGAAIERLDDFNTLLLAHRQLPDVGIRIDLQPVDLRQFVNSF